MKLNWAERAAMNNPVRAMVQRGYEARLLERLGGRVEGGRALEVGCGRGVGVEIILERFGARRVHAFDVDPHMVSLARRRLARYPEERLKLYVGDATAIEEPEDSFDAVFDYGIIHHVPDWRKAVSEVRRVLRPGGTFFFEEVTTHALGRLSYRVLFEHPAEDRFSAQEFVDELERQGIVVGNGWTTVFFGDFVLGAGRRRRDAA